MNEWTHATIQYFANEVLAIVSSHDPQRLFVLTGVLYGIVERKKTDVLHGGGRPYGRRDLRARLVSSLYALNLVEFRLLVMAVYVFVF